MPALASVTSLSTRACGLWRPDTAFLSLYLAQEGSSRRLRGPSPACPGTLSLPQPSPYNLMSPEAGPLQTRWGEGRAAGKGQQGCRARLWGWSPGTTTTAPGSEHRRSETAHSLTPQRLRGPAQEGPAHCPYWRKALSLSHRLQLCFGVGVGLKGRGAILRSTATILRTLATWGPTSFPPHEVECPLIKEAVLSCEPLKPLAVSAACSSALVVTHMSTDCPSAPLSYESHKRMFLYCHVPYIESSAGHR